MWDAGSRLGKSRYTTISARGHFEARLQRYYDERVWTADLGLCHGGSTRLVAVFNMLLSFMGLDALIVESPMNVSFRHRLSRLYDRIKIRFHRWNEVK
jgi:hypothetical protein